MVGGVVSETGEREPVTVSASGREQEDSGGGDPQESGGGESIADHSRGAWLQGEGESVGL